MVVNSIKTFVNLTDKKPNKRYGLFVQTRPLKHRQNNAFALSLFETCMKECNNTFPNLCLKTMVSLIFLMTWLVIIDKILPNPCAIS